MPSIPSARRVPCVPRVPLAGGPIRALAGEQALEQSRRLARRLARRLGLGLAFALLGGCTAPERHSDAPHPIVVSGVDVSPADSALPASARSLPTTDTPDRRRTPARDDVALQRAFDRARQLVETESGTSLAGLTLAIVDDASIDAEVRRETRRLVHRQFDSSRYAEDFVERVMGTQSGTYAALYVPRDEGVLVSRRALGAFLAGLDEVALRDSALLALMIHELVHAADDRRVDIDNVRTLDFRAAFAQSAVFEGHAQHVTRKLCTREACLDGLRALDRFMFGADTPADSVLQSSAALSRNVLEYAYIEGERFVEALADRPDGARSLERLLSLPPRDPIQILDPGSWPDTTRESRNRRLLDAATAATNEAPPASTRWSPIEVSPLRGVNLRDDPTRRRAAIDGFTRLLVAMAAIELHDERDIGSSPIAVTLLEAESVETAVLFARTLHANNRHASGIVPPAAAPTDAVIAGRLESAVLLRTGHTGPNGDTQRTLVARRGSVIVQIAANDQSADALDAYAMAVLDRMTDAVPMPAARPDAGPSTPIASVAMNAPATR